MDDQPRQRIRFLCPSCGAHTVVRAGMPFTTVHCTVCGNTDLEPIPELPPSARSWHHDDEHEDEQD